MNENTQALLLKRVKVVRSAFDEKSIDYLLLEKLYTRYADVGDTHQFVSKAMEQFPLLGCGVASVYLQHALSAGRIVKGTYMGYDHTFLTIDNLIVDITADQYNGPPVYVDALREPWAIKNSSLQPPIHLACSDGASYNTQHDKSDHLRSRHVYSRHTLTDGDLLSTCTHSPSRIISIARTKRKNRIPALDHQS